MDSETKAELIGLTIIMLPMVLIIIGITLDSLIGSCQ
jgi:hypothetical protein